MERRKKRAEGRREKLTLYQSFFEIEMTLSERFQGLTPFGIRREKAGEVFKLIRRLGESIQRDKEINGEIVEYHGRKVLKRKASDAWF